jgi:hypothetical protein
MRGRRRVLCLVCAGVAIVAAPIALALAGRFPPPSTQGLRPASGYGWLCAGAAPSDCPSGSVPSRLRRPLRLAPRAGGASCPTAAAARVNPSYGIALGPGPAYPVPFRQATLHYGHGRGAGGWIYLKVLWIVSAGYRGPVLVRGHQLDGTNWLGFANGVHPLEELQLPPARAGAAKGWRAFPSYTRVRAGSGCYAYQIDGTTFSKVLVFRLEK